MQKFDSTAKPEDSDYSAGPFMIPDFAESHVFNHYDTRPPEISLELAETTRGKTAKIELKYVNLANFKDAIELYEKVRAVIDEKPDTEEKDENQVDA